VVPLGKDDALLWRVVSNVLVVVHGRQAPTDERWAELLRATTQPHPDGARTPIPRRAILIYSLGGLPTTTQRSQLKHVKVPPSSELPAIVLLSSSPLARGVLTALGWIVPALRSMRAYPLEQREAALRSLELEAESLRSVEGALAELLLEARPR
jgi:hypothetical protein